MIHALDLDQIVLVLMRNLEKKPEATVLCGGTGSGQIIKSMQKFFDVAILINAYDDGKSTGKIREAFNMLGPSDIVKNLTTLIDSKKYPGLEAFMNNRFINNNISDNVIIREEIASLLEDKPLSIDSIRGGRFLGLYYGLENQFISDIKKYFSYFYSNLPRDFDLRDCGVRNIVFTGCFLKNNRDYEKTIAELANLFGIGSRIILNSYENRKLVALREDGELLCSEHEIIEYNGHLEIRDLFAIKEPLSQKQVQEISKLKTYERKKSFILDNCDTEIQSNSSAISQLEKSSAIIFGPTTYNSSLLPTLMTAGISEAIRSSSAAKICVMNLLKEQENISASYFPKRIKELSGIALDFIILSNYNSHITNDFLPIDELELQKYGSIIKGDFYAGFGRHQPDFVAKTIFLLSALTKNGKN